MRQIVLACLVTVLASTVYAQRAPEPNREVRVGVESGVVKGAPYSAEVVNDSTQTLADGNRIVRHTVARVYRDREGRTRREVDRPDGTSEVVIHDPIAQASWTLDGGQHTARQLSGTAVLALNDAARGLEPHRTPEQLTVLVNGQLQTIAMGPAAQEMRGQRTEEHLESKTIEGVRVDGVRRTQTIAAGAIGNERPIVVTTEEWTSPDLKVLVLSDYYDPRTGTSTYKLANVSRADPPASLFEVPSDYTIVTAPPRR